MGIDDRWSLNGMQVILLESDTLSLSIIPEHGGVINSLRHTPTNTELLAQVREPVRVERLREGLASDNLLDLMLIGGWYEVLPNAGYVSKAMGATFGLHDETPYLPWKVQFDTDRDPNSIMMRVSLHKYPLELGKRITLNDNEIVLDETVTNHSDVELPGSWLHHPMFGENMVDEFTLLDLPDCEFEVDKYLHPDYTHLMQGFRGKWPMAVDGNNRKVDLSRYPKRGALNCDDLVYVPRVSEGRFRIRNSRRKLTFEAEWDKDIFRSLWIWRSLGGGDSYPWFGRMHGTAVEITTSWPATGLSDQIQMGTAHYFGPRSKTKTTLRFRVLAE